MKFFIPDIKFRLRLTEPYDAMLLFAGVNREILRATPSIVKQIEDARAELPPYRYQNDPDAIRVWDEFENARYKITLPKDTVLSVARVYIRKGASDYSSVTFNIIECPTKRYELVKRGGTWSGGIRNFFVHLDQLDTMEFEPVE